MNTIFTREEAARLHDISENVFGATAEGIIGKIYSKFVEMEMEIPGNNARSISPNDVYSPNGAFYHNVINNYHFVSWDFIRNNDFTNVRGINVQRLFDAIPKNSKWEEFLLLRTKRMSPFVMYRIDRILYNLDADAAENAFNRLVHLKFSMGAHRIRVVKDATPTQYVIVVFLDSIGMIFEHSSVVKSVHDNNTTIQFLATRVQLELYMHTYNADNPTVVCWLTPDVLAGIIRASSQPNITFIVQKIYIPASRNYAEYMLLHVCIGNNRHLIDDYTLEYFMRHFT